MTKKVKHHSEEAKKKMSLARKGQKPWNKGKKGFIPWNKGKFLSLEIREKISKAHLGKPGWMLGKHWSPEMRKKLSEAHKGQVGPNKGKHFSEKARENMSKAHLKFYAEGGIHPRKGKQANKPAWNKGLNKEIDVRLKKASEKQKGKKISEETRKKLSESHKGKHLSEQAKEKLSKAFKGKIPWIKGRHHTEETKRKIQEKNKGKHSGWIKGMHHTKETKEKMGKSHKGQLVSNETKKKISEAQKGEKAHWFGTHQSDEIKLKKRLEWLNLPSEIKAERLRNSLKKTGKHPNSMEQKLIKLFEEKNLPYRYVGNGVFFVNGKNPDFVNTENRKKVIEFCGKYWHSEQIKKRTRPAEEEYLKSHYSEQGYSCLIIWEEGLRDLNKLFEKVKEFDSN